MVLLDAMFSGEQVTSTRPISRVSGASAPSCAMADDVLVEGRPEDGHWNGRLRSSLAPQEACDEGLRRLGGYGKPAAPDLLPEASHLLDELEVGGEQIDRRPSELEAFEDGPIHVGDI